MSNVTLLRQLTVTYSVYVYPVILFLTIVTNTLTILIMSRRGIRLSSCAHYLLAFAIGSLMYTSIRCIPDFLNSRFGIDSQGTPLGCKLRSYFSNALMLHTAYMLVGATFDRFCASSPSPSLHTFIQTHIIQWIIIVFSMLIGAFTSPYLTNYNYNTTSGQCILSPTLALNIYRSSRNAINFLLAPLFMLIFGLLTIGNIRDYQRRLMPIVIVQGRPLRRRIENQLTIMLLSQVGVYLVFSLPLAILNLLNIFNSSSDTPLIADLRDIASIWQLDIFFVSFFLYVVSGRTFRQELLRIFRLA